MGDAEVHTALAHGFIVAVKAFVLSKEQANHLARGINNCPMEGAGGISAKPFIGGGINLDELSWMGLAYAGESGNEFFSFGGFQTLHFLVYWKEQNRKYGFQNLRTVSL